MASINDLFTNALTQTLAAKNDATSRQRVGRPFSKQMKELTPDQFNRLFPRQSHADTQAKLKETLAQLAHSESGAPMAKTTTPAKNGTVPFQQHQQHLPAAKRAKTMTTAQNQDRPAPPHVTDDELEQIIDRTINDDERIYLAEHPNGAADDAAAAEADEQQEEENPRIEPRGSPLINPRLFDDTEVSDIEEDELELDADDDDDDDDGDDDSDSDASGKQRRRAKSKSAKKKKGGAATTRTYRDHAPALAAVSEGANDDEDAFKKVVEATNGTRKRKQPSAGKLTEAAKMGKQEQVARKKKRAEYMAVPEKVEEYRQALLDYIQVAAVNLFNKNASKPRRNDGLVLPFSDLLREDASNDPDLVRMRTSLMRIELEIQESFDIATKAMPQEMTVICDFVSGTDSLRELSSAHTVDATHCGVLQKPFPRDQLIALETTTVFVLGSTVTSRLIVAARLKELIEAVWLLQNLMEVCEGRVQERLLTPLPGFVDGQTTLDEARQLLAKDIGRKSVLQFLSKSVREALVALDTSTHKLTHGI